MFTITDNKTIKLQARGVLKGSRPRPVLVTVLFLVILIVFMFLRAKLSGALDPVLLEQINEYSEAAAAGNIDLAMEYYTKAIDLANSIELPFLHRAIITAINLVSYVITAGYVIFIMNCVRSKDPTVYNILDGFGQFLKVLIVSLLRSVIISFLSLLLIVPGIIAAYTYRFALFNLLDNPGMRAIDALSLSRIMLKGHKMELLKLDLSFIGYILLSIIFPPVLIYLIPYMYSSWIIFYDELRKAEFPQGDLLDNGDDGFHTDDD